MLSLLHSNVCQVVFVQTFVTVTSTTQSLLNPGLYSAMHRMLVTRTTWELVFFAAPFLLRYFYLFICTFLSVSHQLQAFKFLFTSPSSVDIDNENPPPAKRSKNKKATRSNVASLIGLRSVGPRSIAYVAVQVCVSMGTQP